MNQHVLKVFDSFYMPTMEELEKSHTERQKRTEYDYLVSLLQTASTTTHSHKADPPTAQEGPNLENRKQIYKLFEYKDKN